MTYQLEKNIWTDTDFEKMGWHDNHIYKIRLIKDLELDIDYIPSMEQSRTIRASIYVLDCSCDFSFQGC